MYCASCGAQIDDGVLSCPQCGALTASVPDASVSDDAQTANPFARGAACEHTGANDPRLNDVKDYTFQSILASLFCCLPFGLLGIYHSCRCSRAKKRGDFEAATRFSDNAKTDLNTSVIIGLIAITIRVVMVLMEHGQP